MKEGVKKVVKIKTPKEMVGIPSNVIGDTTIIYVDCRKEPERRRLFETLYYEVGA